MKQSTATATNTTKPTATASFKEQWDAMANSHKQQVMQILGWDELHYCNYQYQCGIAYLMWYMPCNQEGRRTLERSKLYWDWWKNLWSLYEEGWLVHKASLKGSSYTTIINSYTELQCPRAKAADVRPNKLVLATLK
jgi:hypothetical protein